MLMLILLMAYLILVTLKAAGMIAIPKMIYLGMCGVAILLTAIPILREVAGRKDA
jgi:hypothetical protein